MPSLNVSRICQPIFIVASRMTQVGKPANGQCEFQVVMLRHGQSEWNQKNLFCGWYDSVLSERGKKEASAAADALKNAKYKFDMAYTSVLRRAQQTLDVILCSLEQEQIPVTKTWRLNERHYGGLTGLNKVETVEKYGAGQVALWRRSYDVPPPIMEPDHPYYNLIVDDPMYSEEPKCENFPMHESLKMTAERTLPFWNNVIVPDILSGKRVLIVAHGNSLRGIVKHLDQICDEDISALNLPTGIPFVYHLDENLKPIEGGSMKFLGDPETVKKAMEEVANQTKVKK